MPPKILAIIGPTGSGKSALALALAQELSGQLIAADSMQGYRGMDIGTAKPTRAEQRLCPHHLLDQFDPDQAVDAGRFVDDADRAIHQVIGARQIPMVVGGTHLYLKALVHGLTPIPEVDQELQQTLYQRLETEGVGGLYQQLLQVDEKAARGLSPNDSARVTRALAVWLNTGKSITAWQEEHQFQQNRYDPLYLAIRWDRAELYRRINLRVHQMVKDGLVSETQRLLDRGVSPTCQSLKSIGYKESVAYAQGKVDLEQMVAKIQQASRRFAKKQLTWLRKMPQVHWLDPADLGEATALVQQFFALARGR